MRPVLVSQRRTRCRRLCVSWFGRIVLAMILVSPIAVMAADGDDPDPAPDLDADCGVMCDTLGLLDGLVAWSDAVL